MARRPEIGNVHLYPSGPLRAGDKNGYVLKFYCPILRKRIRKNAGTRDQREARRIVRECRQRLMNGRYIESSGAIIEAHEIPEHRGPPLHIAQGGTSIKTWEEAFEHYYANRKIRIRESSLEHAASRLDIAKRVLDGYREDRGIPENCPVQQLMTLEGLEYIQDRLIAGDESIYDQRSPMTVNTMMGAIMAFVRHCHRHDWIERVPHLIMLDVDDVMKGRPVTVDEFDRMVVAVPDVVGTAFAPSWERVLRILWESAFRVGDVMNFSWDDERRIHPVWPHEDREHPTLAIPSSQKNKKVQEIPMLPGLRNLLEQTPKNQWTGWVVNPLLPKARPGASADSFRPANEDLSSLALEHSNSAIARACRVSEAAVRKWLDEAGIGRTNRPRISNEVSCEVVTNLRSRTFRDEFGDGADQNERLTKEHVGRIISRIGEQANIIVQQPDEEAGKRIKYASAHDLRRGCAQRLINVGISAETLKIVMRHRDFSTTERFYGATRSAQSAAGEIHQKLSPATGLVATANRDNELSAEELRKLRAILRSV